MRIIVFVIAVLCVFGFSSTSTVAQDTHAIASSAECVALAKAPNASTWCKSKWGSAEEAKAILTLQATWLSKDCAHPPDLSFIAKDFRGTRANGTRLGRETVTKAAGGDDPKQKGRECRIGDVDVQFFSDSTAVLFGSDGWISLNRDGTEENSCMVWSNGWVKREGKWYLVFAQDNAVSCEQWWPTSRDLRTILPNYKELRSAPSVFKAALPPSSH